MKPIVDHLSPNKQVRVRQRAGGIPGPECFEVVNAAVPSPGEGEVLLRTLLVGVEAAVRGWLDEEANYLSIPVGEVVRATAVARVMESRHPKWKPGQLGLRMAGLAAVGLRAGGQPFLAG